MLSIILSTPSGSSKADRLYLLLFFLWLGGSFFFFFFFNAAREKFFLEGIVWSCVWDFVLFFTFTAQKKKFPEGISFTSCKTKFCGGYAFAPVCLFVFLFVNNFLTTILVVEWWSLQGLIATLRSGSYYILKGQGQAKGQIHFIGYNFTSNYHRDLKLRSYFSLWKAAPNMTWLLTLNLKSLPKAKIFETYQLRKTCQNMLGYYVHGIIYCWRQRSRSRKRSNSLNWL